MENGDESKEQFQTSPRLVFAKIRSPDEPPDSIQQSWMRMGNPLLAQNMAIPHDVPVPAAILMPLICVCPLVLSVTAIRAAFVAVSLLTSTVVGTVDTSQR